VTDAADRPLRADAARNADRILRAARSVYADVGPDASVDVVAREAGVGERTLYRHFPSKADLIRAALDQSIEENLSPVIDRARRSTDALKALVALLDAATSLGALEQNLLIAARKAGALANISVALNETLEELAERARVAGQIRADLVAGDMPRIIAMLNSVLWTMNPADDGWRRYLVLLLDAITTTDGRRLPPAPDLVFEPPTDWPV
jgi:AcrR family transcriptional regulator